MTRSPAHPPVRHQRPHRHPRPRRARPPRARHASRPCPSRPVGSGRGRPAGTPRRIRPGVAGHVRRTAGPGRGHPCAVAGRADRAHRLHIGARPARQARLPDMLAPVRSLASGQDAVAPLTQDGWLFWPDDPLPPVPPVVPAAPARGTHPPPAPDPARRAARPHADRLQRRPASRSGPPGLRHTEPEETPQPPQHRQNRNAYTNAKSEFVARVLHAASLIPHPATTCPNSVAALRPSAPQRPSSSPNSTPVHGETSLQKSLNSRASGRNAGHACTA